MRTHTVPPDTRDKEKLFGGKFTISQFIFIILGFIVGGLFAYSTFKIYPNIIVILIVFAIGVIPFLPFSFIKIRKMGDMELFSYLVLKIRYNKKTKKFANINENYRNYMGGVWVWEY